GRERVGVVFGWIFGAHQLGAAVAAWGAGAARTWLGDYQSAFVTAGLLVLGAGGLRVRVGGAPLGGGASRPGPVAGPAAWPERGAGGGRGARRGAGGPG